MHNGDANGVDAWKRFRQMLQLPAGRRGTARFSSILAASGKRRANRWQCSGGLYVLLGSFLVLLASCANPVPPSGGPRDTTPPSIAETDPVQDTVNVPTDTRSVFVGFSEYVERNTLPQALSVTPPFEGRLRFNWSGQGVTIELPEPLRDSTTYLFTFDTDLSDANGVSLDEPITVAFSTGPRINQGEIRGRVVEPGRGEGQERVDVYAYALPSPSAAPPDSLPDQPAYRTQTSEDGTFSFEYMREQPYYVVALRDNNRNRTLDPAEPFAVPPRLALVADSGRGEVPVPWLLSQADTSGPTFQQGQSLSRQRVRLSFDEPVRLASRAPKDWALRDSLSEAPVAVRAVYRPSGRDDAVIVRTAPMEPTRHALPLTSDLVTDTLGQGLAPDTARFAAVSQEDTTRTRFRAFVPEESSSDTTEAYPLLPDQRPGVRFNQAPDSTVLRRALSLRDTTGADRAYDLTTEDGRTYRFRADPPLEDGEFVDVVVDGRSIAGPDTTTRRRFRRVTSRVLGELEGRAVVVDTARSESPSGDEEESPRLPNSVEEPREEDTLDGALPDTGSVDSVVIARRDSLLRAGDLVVELIPTESTLPLDPRRRTTPPGSTFVFRELPEGTFRFRAFQDRNENGRWDGGQVQPYVPAEPVTWSEETVDSRPRWTNVLSAPLRIPFLLPVSLSRTTPPPDTTAPDSTGG